MHILNTHHLAITTSRFERLRAFYVETLGLPVVGDFPGHHIIFIRAGSTAIELIGKAPAPDEAAPPEAAGNRVAHASESAPEAERARRSGWHHLAWEVADVDEAIAELTEKGVACHSPPESFPAEAPAMRIAFFLDPDGNLLELVQPLGGRYP